jgi:dynein heavy chain
MNFEDRLSFLQRREIRAIYLNICRGLFERHKTIYSFMLATAVQKHDNKLTDDELDFLLRGALQVKEEAKPKELTKITEKQWNGCLFLQDEFKVFSNLTTDLNSRLELKIKDQNFILIDENEKEPENDWNRGLNSFQKLMLISIFKPEEVMLGLTCYIRDTLGKEFVESKTTSIAAVYEDMSPTMPLIFILSSGSDPMNSLQKFANEKDFIEKLFSISLGQGQGPAAEALLNKGRNNGEWIYLQNCHLATSWMPRLEGIVRDMTLGNIKIHSDFRLFLSSMPIKTFPVSVLQNSVKLTNEPPKGLKSNLMRSLIDMSEDTFEIHILGNAWRKMIFGMCMFHGCLLERKRFGSLGFNILYEFNDSDRECALKVLQLFVDREVRKDIPWQALEYINGEITYGGRVTDEWDQRCVRTILNQFARKEILDENYAYSESGIYKCPESPKLDDFKRYVSQLPMREEPEIFGMHENANIVFETKEANFFLSTILETQMKASSSQGGSSDSIIMDVIQKIKSTIVKSLNMDNMNPILLKMDDKGRVFPLTTVLQQETERFNKLLRVVHSSLNDLEKGIKGLIVMSETLEAVFESFLMNQIPQLWNKNGYLSTKSLGSWIEDLIIRIEHIQVIYLNLIINHIN